MQTVIIDVDNDANVQISVKGVKGKKCKEITKPLEEALGVVTNSTPTSEYREQEATHQRNVSR